MANEIKAFYEKFEKDTAKMKELAGNMMTGFGTLFTKVMGEGVLTIREKELIALGIAVATQCEPCIKLHVKKCLGAGAIKEQILEAASVAVMMAGGSGFTHVPLVIDAIEASEESD